MSKPEKTVRRMEVASVAVTILQIGTVAAVWFSGIDGPIPIHFNASGEADGWAPRQQVAILLAANTIIAAISLIVCSRIAHGPRVADYSPANWRSFTTGWMIGMVIPSLFAVFLAALGLGWTAPTDLEGPRWIQAFTGLILVVAGALIGKTSPNPFVGVRTYWSKRSRLAWDKSNRLAGRLFCLIGLAGVVSAPFSPAPMGVVALVVAMAFAAFWAVYESFRVWRTDPDRQP
ncbi:SdpI family protein [Caulobacter sp. 73W]|uniref:SdpI family protein n=1 Tax=Caulobacter sp. 73W TaxID=3161137 RepID=A0AB39KN91_9CAUL